MNTTWCNTSDSDFRWVGCKMHSLLRLLPHCNLQSDVWCSVYSPVDPSEYGAPSLALLYSTPWGWMLVGMLALLRYTTWIVSPTYRNMLHLIRVKTCFYCTAVCASLG